MTAAGHARADAFAGGGAKITAADRAADDEFGVAIDLDVDTLVAGAHRNSDNGTHSGSAYVFSRNQGGANAWGQTAKLLASDAAGGDKFGSAVAGRGNLVIVGAPFKNSANGAVYIFERDYPSAGAWGQVARLAGAGGEQFGWSVDIDGDWCVVGAPFNDARAGDAGAAYVFHRTGTGTSLWAQVKQLTAADAALNDAFGSDVALSGDTVVVGSPMDGASDPGSAYVFQRNQGGVDQWGQVKRIVSANISLNDQFGTSVDIRGDRIAVGAPYEDTAASNGGAAYVFERNQGGVNQWGQVAQLNAADGASGDRLGTRVAIDGDLVVAGAMNEGRTLLSEAGAAYLFFRNQGGTATWGQAAKLVADDANANDHFGSAVAVGPLTVMAGAMNDNAPAPSCGSVYPFLLSFNNPPVIANQSFTIPENTPNGTRVGTVAAGPGDAGQTVTFSITGGNTGGAFAIGPASGAISVLNSNALDYEAVTRFLLTVQAADNGSPPLASSATITINLTDLPEGADLLVTKSAAGTGLAGDPLTYTVTVRNLGPLTATNVVVTDLLPAGVTPTGSVTNAVGNLAAGQQHSFPIAVTVDSSVTAPLTNRVAATTDTHDLNPANNAFTLVTPIAAAADLAVVKSAPGRVDPGAAFAYTITVTNAGPSDAVEVSCLDTLPAGLVAGGVVSNALGVLPAGTSHVFLVDVQSDGAFLGKLTNRVLVAADTADPDPTNNTAEAVTTVNYLADVGIGKSAPALVTDTGTIVYLLTVTNYGPSVATGVLVTDPLPAGLSFDPAASDPLCGGVGTDVVCELGAVVPSGIVVLQVAATLSPSVTGLVVNTAAVTTTAIDPNPANDLADASTLLPDFDGDGIADFADADDDDDQIPDDWEIAHGLNRYNAADADEDPDGDGFTNLEEYIADTVPTDPLSRLVLTGIHPIPAVAFLSSSNRLYSLEYAADPPIGPWLPAPGQTDLPGIGGPQVLDNPNPDPARHYRIRAHLP